MPSGFPVIGGTSLYHRPAARSAGAGSIPTARHTSGGTSASCRTRPDDSFPCRVAVVCSQAHTPPRIVGRRRSLSREAFRLRPRNHQDTIAYLQVSRRRLVEYLLRAISETDDNLMPRADRDLLTASLSGDHRGHGLGERLDAIAPSADKIVAVIGVPRRIADIADRHERRIGVDPSHRLDDGTFRAPHPVPRLAARRRWLRRNIHDLGDSRYGLTHRQPDRSICIRAIGQRPADNHSHASMVGQRNRHSRSRLPRSGSLEILHASKDSDRLRTGRYGATHKWPRQPISLLLSKSRCGARAAYMRRGHAGSSCHPRARAHDHDRIGENPIQREERDRERRALRHAGGDHHRGRREHAADRRPRQRVGYPQVGP